MASIRTIAWDGIEFEVPADWELSAHDRHREIGSLVLEDSFEVRLEMEWTGGGNPRRIAHIEKRHGVFAQQVETIASASRTIDRLPSPWVAQDYETNDGRRLITALHAGRGHALMAFLRLHAKRADEGPNIVNLARKLIGGFRFHSNGLIPWRVYDFDLLVPVDYRFSAASFHAGRSLMVFERRFRRLFVWQFSLARRLLGSQAPEDFAARFLDRFKGLPGPRFVVSPEGRLLGCGKWHHPFGHYEEIGRGCHRYHAQALSDLENDRLIIVVFHYRNAGDLEALRAFCPSGRDAVRRVFHNVLRSEIDAKKGKSRHL